MKQYSFCHGWMVEKRTFAEVTCKQRERCQYYSEDFYRHHGDHLDDFEEMFPFEPCPYFLERIGETKKEKQPSLFDLNG